MIVFAFATVYLACSALIVAVWRQDRRRHAARTPPPAREPQRSRTPTLVFRTQA